MLPNLLYVLGGLVLLAAGADGLVRGSTSIALRLGITPLVIGLTVVAFGTGSPELTVSVEAAYRGDSGIALGNVTAGSQGEGCGATFTVTLPLAGTRHEGASGGDTEERVHAAGEGPRSSPLVLVPRTDKPAA